MRVELRAGFARPWICWDTETNVVTVDDRRVPCTHVGCSNVNRPRDSDDPDRRHAIEPCLDENGRPVGFEMSFHLENGLVAVSVVTDADSVIWLVPDFDVGGSFLRTPTGVAVDHRCTGYFEEGCVHPLFAYTPFETYEELMAHLDKWSRWEVTW